MKITIDLDDLKTYLSQMNSEKTEWWGKENRLNAEVFNDYFDYLGHRCSKEFNTFTNEL